MFFLLSLIFFCMPLISMEFELPSCQKGLTEAQKEYYLAIETQFKDYFKQTLCTQYAQENPNDLIKTPIIQRFDTVVCYYAMLLHDFRTKNTTQKLPFNDIDKKDAKDALSFVLSRRPLITFIARGKITTDQPLMVRPEFDQLWSKIYQEIRGPREVRRGAALNEALSRRSTNIVSPRNDSSDSRSSSDEEETFPAFGFTIPFFFRFEK